ncbi:MAG: hypothetical protein ACR2IZ_01160 [Candidatus Nanopelagicus sp.]
MKKVAILLVPLIFLAAFLSIKPPAVSVVDKPAKDKISSNVPSTKSPGNKPVIAGQTEDDENAESVESGKDKSKKPKPSYGGHDDDDYDDD